MESLTFSKRLQDYLKQHGDINEDKQIEISKGTIEIFGNFLYNFFILNLWYLKDIIIIDNSKMFFIGVLKQSMRCVRFAIQIATIGARLIKSGAFRICQYQQ